MSTFTESMTPDERISEIQRQCKSRIAQPVMLHAYLHNAHEDIDWLVQRVRELEAAAAGRSGPQAGEPQEEA